MSAVGLLWDALGDAEAEAAEVRQLRIEVTKLRRLLVVRLCNCRPMAITLPIEPLMHSTKCTYRCEMQ